LSDPLAALRHGGKAALARALAQAEAAPDAEATLALLDAAWAAPKGHVIGLTGPPGVGKSTLVSALVRAWRANAQTVGVIAVDPSSRRTGGALLGDRTRIEVDPEDLGVFVRSMAARDRLGGLSDLCAAAAVLMRALYDIVVIETVGVGQSETEVADLADSVILAIQPASGDSLQYMKAGIVETPDIAVVTKADLGSLAERARRDLELALSITTQPGGWRPKVLSVAAATGEGIEALLDATVEHLAWLADGLSQKREAQGRLWLSRAVREELGRRGAERVRSLTDGSRSGGSPFRQLTSLLQHAD
jgi:LAO/AO transport system kinase